MSTTSGTTSFSLDVTPTTKLCTKCGEEKLLDQFYPDRRPASKNKIESQCKSCKQSGTRRWKKENRGYLRDYKNSHEKRKHWTLRSVYGIGIEDYNRMFDQQKGCCKICDTHQSQLKKALHVDHDHETGAVRALLCQKCNTALGMINDSKKILRSMLEYLEVHNDK